MVVNTLNSEVGKGPQKRRINNKINTIESAQSCHGLIIILRNAQNLSYIGVNTLLLLIIIRQDSEAISFGMFC